ncbi:MAG: protoheme IX farnesyltransferase [Pelagibacteraceae bacterium TMED124]|nr:protoheme IX farnesyltransferase [Rickettsiales bacterium]RPG19513.1 MAG: protoheme IX farnesyltransferase [Pelagibacteraceae bacterium TMED124]
MSSKSAINQLNEPETQSSLEDFISLLKPRVMSLAVFTSVSGLILSPATLHPFLCILSIFCISLGAGASGAINMWFDRDIDKMMERTKNRPIPSKKIMAGDALGFGIILSLVSVVILGLSVNYFAAFLLALSISFYIFIYTIWLKRRTPQNIVIGGAAGAFPPVIGWACATGDVSTFPIILFVLIFIWTPPHFWALALYKDTEYSRAKIPMLPVVKGQRKTKQQILAYSLLLFLASLSPYYFGFSGIIYLFFSLILGVYFVYLAFKIFISNDENKTIYAPKLFKYSILYLYLVFLILVIDKYV